MAKRFVTAGIAEGFVIRNVVLGSLIENFPKVWSRTGFCFAATAKTKGLGDPPQVSPINILSQKSLIMMTIEKFTEKNNSQYIR